MNCEIYILLNDLFDDIEYYIEYTINRINDNEQIDNDDIIILNMYDNELYELLNKYNVFTYNLEILQQINNYNKQINYNGFIKSINYVKPSIELIKNNIINYVYSIIDIMIKYDYSNTIKIAEFGLLIDKSFNDWLFENSNDNDKLKYGLTLLETNISYDTYQKIKHLYQNKK